MGGKRKPNCILFDEKSRHEFLTGFHKRKVERRKKFEEKLENELKEAKKRIKAKAREMTKKMVNVREEDHELPMFQKCYELPDHTVQIRELSTAENTWIGENKSRLKSESESEHEDDVEDHFKSIDDAVPGMELNSIKAVRKAVGKQSLAMMQRDKVFRKKCKIDRAKNKKETARKKKVLGKKEKRKRKRRR